MDRCEGPYCADCDSCPLCDELRAEELDEFWAEEDRRLTRLIHAAGEEA